MEVLRNNGKEVFVLAPTRTPLGPFSMNKGAEAFDRAFAGTSKILNSTDEGVLGARDLA